MSEAEHLSEIYDDGEMYFEPYSRFERREYIREKSHSFNKKDVGKYVIAQTPRKNRGVVERLYLVDRRKTTRFWWSHDATFAMIFEDKEAASRQAAKYKYNKARVIQIVN